MGITSLPISTVRALGASQVLNDPAAVVKELLDNALDARATSIAIEISSNTVDLIQVRDNGHGIPPEDRLLVARPHCTSKIACEEDLNAIGGSSLGFRGEALASVAELSGSLTISTRVEGEQVAVALRVNQQGEVDGQERTSLPVGTAVKITEFIKAYPVRKENALKSSEKCLKRIKQTLQSYAFARPQVRLSLRVSKGKNNKADWTYAPKVGGNAEDAAFKVVGAICASQCIWSVIEDRGFALQAFLPKPGIEVAKVRNIGPFLSIDGRPVSASRGISKQIVKLFKEALRDANASFDGVREPFIYLDIACPPSTYDANVEPAKDDVVFEDPDIVFEAAKRLFDAVYPAHEVIKPSKDGSLPISNSPQQDPQLLEEDDFVTSLESPSGSIATSRPMRLVPDKVIQSMDDVKDDYPGEVVEQVNNRTFRPNMYGCDEEDLELIDERPATGEVEADIEEMRQAQKDIKVSNPWVIAQMHAASQRSKKSGEDAKARSKSDVSDANSLNKDTGRQFSPIDLDRLSLPTPRPSSPMLYLEGYKPPGTATDISLGGDARMIGPRSLPAPRLLRPTLSPLRETEKSVSHLPSRSEQPPYDYTLSSQASESMNTTPLHAIIDLTRTSRYSPRKHLQQTHINKPFVSPLKDQSSREKVWFDHLESHESGRQRATKRRPHQKNGSSGLVIRGELDNTIEDCQLLTPPRRNRDMREFITHVELSTSDTAASLIESRNYPNQQRNCSESVQAQLPDDQDVVNSVSAEVLNGSRFESGNQLVANQARYRNAKKGVQRPLKRRKTSDSRALRELSGNSQDGNGEDEEFRPGLGNRAPSRRRRTADGDKVYRTKSSQQPLERVPEGQGTQNIILNLQSTCDIICQLSDNNVHGRTRLGLEENVQERYNTLSVLPTLAELEDLTSKLYNVLISRVSDGEMVQDLGMLVQEAFTAHDMSMRNGHEE